MYELIQTVYNPQQQLAFEKLYVDSSSKDQFLLRSSLAQALKDSPKILSSNGIDWIFCTLTQHEREENETIRVFQGIMKCLRNFSYGLLTDKIEWREMNDVADYCLVGIGFFRSSMEKKHRQHAAPSVEYYAEAGSLAFRRVGFEELSDHFNGWTDFMEKELSHLMK